MITNKGIKNYQKQKSFITHYYKNNVIIKLLSF